MVDRSLYSRTLAISPELKFIFVHKVFQQIERMPSDQNYWLSTCMSTRSSPYLRLEPRDLCTVELSFFSCALSVSFVIVCLVSKTMSIFALKCADGGAQSSGWRGKHARAFTWISVKERTCSITMCFTRESLQKASTKHSLT